jgi:DNA-binding beta-propeller fold protein YncE
MSVKFSRGTRQNLSVLNGTCHVIATIAFPTGSEPWAAAFDPVNNRVYVTDENLSQIYAVAPGGSFKTITNPHFDAPRGVLFDPATNQMAVANSGGNTVTFISGTTVKGTTPVGSFPQLLAYDPFAGRLLVADFNSYNVTSLSARSPTVQRYDISIPVGSFPFGIAYDYANHHDYVTNEGTNNTTVISGTGAHFGSVSVGGYPLGIAWDQSSQRIYVANLETNNVSVVRGLHVVRTITGASGSAFVGLAYDDATDQMFVTEVNNGLVYVYS